jgi:mRNA interferase MazF
MFGEIFICQFPFTSGAASKIRPALVLFDLEQDAIICRVTGVLRTGALDVTLKDWQTAGLLKPSVARLDRHGANLLRKPPQLNPKPNLRPRSR